MVPTARQALLDNSYLRNNMDPLLKQKITDKLRAYLNREPLEHEIINGQNDSTLMHWIAQDDTKANAEAIATLKINTEISINSINPN